MRDPNRLDQFYVNLNGLHKTYVPDWRFGQMIVNYIRATGDPFFDEEDKTLAKIEAWLKEITNTIS